MVYNSYQNHGIQPSKPWCSHPRYHEMPKIPKIIAKKSSSRVIFWHQKSIIGHQFRLRMNHPGHDFHISPRLWCPLAVRSLGNSAPAMPGGAPSPAVPPGGGGSAAPPHPVPPHTMAAWNIFCSQSRVKRCQKNVLHVLRVNNPAIRRNGPPRGPTPGGHRPWRPRRGGGSPAPPPPWCPLSLLSQNRVRKSQNPTKVKHPKSPLKAPAGPPGGAGGGLAGPAPHHHHHQHHHALQA